MQDTQQAPTTTETFVVLGQNYWGRGASLAEAKAQFRRMGGQLGRGYLILTFDAETVFHGVDGMGYYSWTGNAPTEQTVAAR